MLSKPKTILSSLLAILLSGVVSVAFAAPMPWIHVVTVKAEDNASAPAGYHVYTVPMGSSLVLTDVVMTHNVITTAATFRANIRRGPASNASACDSAGLVLGPYVNPMETVSINLKSGIKFEEGEQICIAIGHASGTDGITFSLIGRLF